MDASSQDGASAAHRGLAHPVVIAFGLCLLGLAFSWAIWRLGLVTEDSAWMSAFLCAVVFLSFLSVWFRALILNLKAFWALVVWIWTLFAR